MEPTQDKKGEMPFTPKEAELLIPVVRARIEIRAENRRRRRLDALRRSAFAFNLFPRPATRAPGPGDDAENGKDRLEDIGDHLRLAMLEYAAGRFQ